MIEVRLKGVAKTIAKGRIYYYAWRGGPRLHGEPGSPEFIASYNNAYESRRMVDKSRFRSIVVLYKASGDYLDLAASTRNQWAPWLDRIADYFGNLRIAQFDRPEKIRPIIRRWRNRWADTPRTADYGLQVLSRVLSYAVDPLGKIGMNPCEGIKRLYTGGNRAEIVWTEADIDRLVSSCSAEIGHAVQLAACTGLRRGDLMKLSWSHVGDDAIIMRTGKSGHRREAIIPLYDRLREVLGAIPKRSTIVLTSSRKTPWTDDGFGSSFDKAKKAAGMHGANLHFHDLRGTAVTRLYGAGLPMRVIAEVTAWDEESVEKIIRRYVGRSAATKALIEQINKSERRT